MNEELDREAIIEILPEYINGSLDASLIKKIEHMAENDRAIQLEVEFLSAIQKSVKEDVISSPTEWGLTRLKKSIQEQSITEQQTSAPSGLWKKMAIAASMAFVIQTGLVINDKISTEDDYQLLSNDSFNDTVQLKFKPEANEQSIRALLINLEGNIVKGPSAIGTYTIKFSDTQKSLKALKSSSLVEYSEYQE